jgi:hypothetical protein
VNSRTVLQSGIPAIGPVCVLLVVVFLAMGVSSSSAQVPSPEGYVQKSEKGSIDWLNGKASSVGIGAPPPNAVNAAQARAMAQRAAVVIARRNLMELLKGVQLDSTSTVQNFMVADDTVVSKVQGQLEQAEIDDTAYMSDGSVEVTVSVSLRGAMSKTLLPPEQLRGASMPSTPPKEKSGPERVDPARTQPQRPARPAIPGEGGVTPVRTTPQEDFSFGATVGGGYSGLVVDARGLGARPAMSPRIVDEQGREVYGSSLVGREYAIQQGMAGYAKDLDKAQENDRVAGNPLLVKAKDLAGQAGSDLVVSNDDAERIRHAAAGSEFLKQCRVMIVLD